MTLAEELQAMTDKLRGIRAPVNQGSGSALRAAKLRRARKDEAARQSEKEDAS